MKGVYLVTDRGLCGGRSLADVVLEAVRGGVSCVQLREKTFSTRDFVAEALAVRELLRPFPVPLIINDRIDVALAGGADGVHIGGDDMPYDVARRLMGERAIIGVSVETWDDVEYFQGRDVSYIAASPVFATPTKTDTGRPWGLEGLRAIKSFSRHPLVAIGGINESNAREVVEAGADSLAVVSAVCAADDPEKAARRLRDIVDAATAKS
ncbi:MAG: thiamine phosphate synthase [Syntrophales bacterium]|jgi:thiamine-phosphate pyrophosphorylase|nr:thiamine phosphate synthase [Syntrophales bacterium]MCK9527841.1 thiamine phosphate synthase [Syntrophales bacterium]MDX9922061.1 thiamine phosphate synthase [Syntrophales bacterium]